MSKTDQWAEPRTRLILAAQTAFTSMPYQHVSVAMIAALCDVELKRALKEFASKEELYMASMHLPCPPEVIVGRDLPSGSVGERVVGRFLDAWERDGNGPVLRSLIQAALEDQVEAQHVHDYLLREIVRPAAEQMAGPESFVRVALVGSQLMGLALSRHALKIEPLASADHSTLVAWTAPVITHYLQEPLSEGGSRGPNSGETAKGAGRP